MWPPLLTSRQSASSTAAHRPAHQTATFPAAMAMQQGPAGAPGVWVEGLAGVVWVAWAVHQAEEAGEVT
jgi:hypothetical protein